MPCQSDSVERTHYEAQHNIAASRCDRVYPIVAPRYSNSDLAAHLPIAGLHVKVPVTLSPAVLDYPSSGLLAIRSRLTGCFRTQPNARTRARVSFQEFLH